MSAATAVALGAEAAPDRAPVGAGNGEGKQRVGGHVDRKGRARPERRLDAQHVVAGLEQVDRERFELATRQRTEDPVAALTRRFEEIDEELTPCLAHMLDRHGQAAAGGQAERVTGRGLCRGQLACGDKRQLHGPRSEQRAVGRRDPGARRLVIGQESQRKLVTFGLMRVLRDVRHERDGAAHGAGRGQRQQHEQATGRERKRVAPHAA